MGFQVDGHANSVTLDTPLPSLYTCGNTILQDEIIVSGKVVALSEVSRNSFIGSRQLSLNIINRSEYGYVLVIKKLNYYGSISKENRPIKSS